MALSAFAPDCIDQVYLIAAAGMSDSEMCRVFGVSMGKLRQWRLMYKDFDEAISRGRLLVDAKVTEALYRNAVGHSEVNRVVTKRYDEDGVLVGEDVREEVVNVPGQLAAQKFWLTNRNREAWQERKEVQVNVTHTLGARLNAALERIGRVGPPSLAAPSGEREALPAEFVELPGDADPVVGVSPADPESAE